MENKFYVPSIEEFHIGFEFEVEDLADDLKSKRWVQDKVTTPLYLVSVEEWLNKKEIRVKYLDFIDLEELGFKHIGGKLTEGIMQDFVMNNDRYFIHLQATWFSAYVGIRIQTSVEENSVKTLVVHSIRIKNKSELKKLLLQLGMLTN